jgi:hypothetical protein
MWRSIYCKLYLTASLPVSYDHLDWPTIEAILKLKGPNVQFLAPLGQPSSPHGYVPHTYTSPGNKSWFTSGGVPEPQVKHMDWGQELVLAPPGFNTRVRFICTAAQHSSGWVTGLI